MDLVAYVGFAKNSSARVPVIIRQKPSSSRKRSYPTNAAVDSVKQTDRALAFSFG